MTEQNKVWRFGYGSNMGYTTLTQKKNLEVFQYKPGILKDWKLTFDSPGIDFVEPAFACIRPEEGQEVHGVAFQISKEQAVGLDRQESGYNVKAMSFYPYDGDILADVGVYAPKSEPSEARAQRLPSRRYLGLLQKGAKEAGLSQEYQEFLSTVPYYKTPENIRAETKQEIARFEADAERNQVLWSAEKLALHNGSNPSYPAHTSVLGYVVKVKAMFPSWRGHSITRRNLVHYRGRSVDKEDIRFGSQGFLPLPRVQDCSEEEVEYLFQNLDRLLQKGEGIVGRLEEFLDSQ